MKPLAQELFLALGWLAASLAAPALNAAVAFTLTPPAISNTYSAALTLQATGLTAGDTVVIQKFLDANTNGVVDAGDLLVQQFQLTDGLVSAFTNGAASVTNFNVPGDTDGAANGQITAQLYPSMDFAQEIVGKYLFVLSSPAGHFKALTNSFSVTNFPFAQSFTGTVVSSGSPVANAVVLLFQPANGGQNPQGGTVANNSGAYSIKAPPGTYELAAFKSNFVANLNVAPYVTLGAGATITTNLPLTNATESIVGNLVDTNNSSLGLPGMLVPVTSTNNYLTVTFTDTNGNFVARVRTNSWKVQVSDQSIMLHGYVRASSANVNTSTGNVSGVTLAMPKATAIFYGTVTDNLGNPLTKIEVGGDDNASNGGHYEYESEAYTYTNGNYVLCALAGDGWEVYINSQDQYGIYTNYLFTEAPSQQNGGLLFGVRQAAAQNFTGILATNYITGNVQFNGSPVVGVGVNASATIGGVAYQSHTDTDTNGNYSLNVANGAWSVSLNCGGGGDGLDNLLGTGNFQCPNNGSVTINNNPGTASFIVLTVNAGQIFGFLTDAYGNGIAGVSVYASDGGGDHYATTTDASGFYLLSVVAGGYEVSVDCGQLTARNKNCVSDDLASVSDNTVEADFATAFIITPAYPFAMLHGFSATSHRSQWFPHQQ